MDIIFTGDISITGVFIEKIKKEEEIFSKKIIKAFKNSDYVVSNLEGPVTNIIPRKSNHIKLKNPINTIEYLAKRNLKVFNLANNHILDCKETGLNQTLEAIKKSNCNSFGAGKGFLEASQAHVLEVNDCKVALLGITISNVNKKEKKPQIFTSKYLSVLKDRVSSLYKKVDYIVINYHGGEEFTNYPSPTKRKFLKKISKIKGVDIIIAHHSHTLQAYEKYKGAYIFYSLGNFIFDISAHYPYLHTRESALLNFKFSKKGLTFSWIPFLNNNGNIVDTDKDSFETYFKSISDFTQYKKKWRQEAYRVLFRKNLLKTSETDKIDTSKSLQEKSFLKLMISKNFYSKSIKILLSNNYRSLYLSAVIHKIKKHFS